MATYQYLCMACEHLFEERRPMDAGPVATALTCPSCGSDRVRRRYSFSTAVGGTNAAPSAGCGCGACTCGAG